MPFSVSLYALRPARTQSQCERFVKSEAASQPPLKLNKKGLRAYLFSGRDDAL